MNIIGYYQSDKLDQLVSAVPEGSIFEVTIYNDKKASPDGHTAVYIDGQMAYNLDFNKKQYQKPDSTGIFRDFYLTDTEALYLYMYLHNFRAPVTPHWWPYAARNIMRHGDPLKELREAQKENKTIVIME